MFRTVKLPRGITGTLLLHSMPGRHEPFAAARAAIANARVSRVVCLTPEDEIFARSPEYAAAIRAGVPWTHVACPIPDFGIPEDRERFTAAVNAAADALRRGENVLVHCAAGIGRTGTFAAAVLCALGLPLHDARKRVHAAGSSAESEIQKDFLKQHCGTLAARRRDSA